MNTMRPRMLERLSAAASSALLLAALYVPALRAAPAPAKPAPDRYAELRMETGLIEVRVKVTGIATAQDSYDIFADFDGRVEDVQAKVFDLVTPEGEMAKLASTEMAALMDSASPGTKDQMENRWKGVYDYQPVKPEFHGIVTAVHVSPKERVRKGDRLFTVAKKVVLIGKNTEKLYSRLSPGMTAELADRKDGWLKLRTKLVNSIPLKDDPHFSRLWLEVDGLQRGIRIGEQFDGILTVGRNEAAMVLPKQYVFNDSGKRYVVLEVETGLESEDKVELLRRGSRFISSEELGITRKDGQNGKAKKND